MAKRTAVLLVAMVAASAAAQQTRAAGTRTPAPATLGPSGGYYALVIGIDEYPPPMPRLKTPVHDAQAIAALLHERYGFEVKLLLNGAATRTNILDAVTHYQETLGENDSLLIYYAGHGYSIRNPDKSYDKAYWLPVDASSVTSANRIIADDLTTDIRQIAARHVLIVSDSCYAGGLSREGSAGVGGAVTTAYLNKMAAGRSRNLMASGGDEPVADGGPDGHSIFAAAILHALGAAEEPVVTAGYLFYDAIRPMVGGGSDQLPQYDVIRNSGHESGDFVFVRKSAEPRVEVAAKPVTTERAVTAPAPAAAEAPTPAAVQAPAPGVSVDRDGHLRYSTDPPEPAATESAISFRSGLPVPASLCEAGIGSACARARCDAGDKQACRTFDGVVEVINGGKVESRKITAKEWARTSRTKCDAKDGSECALLGSMYAGGFGVAKDLNQAASLFGDACDLGVAGGCGNLGGMYLVGAGVAPDQRKAALLLQKGCDGGYADACRLLGIAYERGLGVGADTRQALNAFRKACELKDEPSCDAAKRLQP